MSTKLIPKNEYIQRMSAMEKELAEWFKIRDMYLDKMSNEEALCLKNNIKNVDNALFVIKNNFSGYD